jgi:D-sedoheptulose 7-phosphate isomerase
MVGAVATAHLRGGTIYVCGNGGSAATASHIACDLQKWAGVRAIALTDNVPLITAWANDRDYSEVYAWQIERLARPIDVLLCLSCSGTSPNVVVAAQAMKDTHGAVLALIGHSGGDLKALADVCICVPSDFYPQIEDCHSAIGHALAVALKERLQ